MSGLVHWLLAAGWLGGSLAGWLGWHWYWLWLWHWHWLALALALLLAVGRWLLAACSSLLPAGSRGSSIACITTDLPPPVNTFSSSDNKTG